MDVERNDGSKLWDGLDGRCTWKKIIERNRPFMARNGTGKPSDEFAAIT